MPKSFKNLRKINDLGIFEPSWRTSWKPLGRLGGILRAPWAVLRPSWAVLGPSRAVLEASWGHLGILRASWTSWRRRGTVLEAILGHLSRLGGNLGRLGDILEAILAVLEAIQAVLEASWRPSWAILAVWRRLGNETWVWANTVAG